MNLNLIEENLELSVDKALNNPVFKWYECDCKTKCMSFKIDIKTILPYVSVIWNNSYDMGYVVRASKCSRGKGR